jgi:hypothetical protein
MRGEPGESIDERSFQDERIMARKRRTMRFHRAIQALAGCGARCVAQGLPERPGTICRPRAWRERRRSVRLYIREDSFGGTEAMATDPAARAVDAAMDETSLYREEIYTDRRVGTLRVLLPVKADGSADTARPTLYQGEAQLMTNVGPLPISFDIDADNLADAVAGYGDATKAGIERAMRELQEMRRQASSSIVLPPAGASLGPGGTLGGGGKIQIP